MEWWQIQVAKYAPFLGHAVDGGTYDLRISEYIIIRQLSVDSHSENEKAKLSYKCYRMYWIERIPKRCFSLNFCWMNFLDEMRLRIKINDYSIDCLTEQISLNPKNIV